MKAKWKCFDSYTRAIARQNGDDADRLKRVLWPHFLKDRAFQIMCEALAA